MARGDPKLVLYGPDAKHGAKAKKGFKEYRWYIRHKETDISTGLGLGERKNAILALSDYMQGLNVRPSTVTIDQALKTYAANVSDEFSKINTKRAMTHLLPVFTGRACHSITKDDTDRYYAARIAEGAAAATARGELAQFKSAVSHTTKGAVNIPIPPPAEPTGKAATRNQVAAIIRQKRAFLKSSTRFNMVLFILITFYCCQRKEAVRGLKWRPERGHGYVDLDAGVIDFRRHGMPQNRKRRAVQPIPRQLRVLLRLARKRTSEFVFEIERGHQPSSSYFEVNFRKMRNRAKLPHIRGHDILHTGLTLRAKTVPQYVLSKFANKSARTLNAVYLHAEMEAVAAITNESPGKLAKPKGDAKRDAMKPKKFKWLRLRA